MQEILIKLIPNIMDKPEQLLSAVLETLLMVGVAGVISFVLGLCLGVMLVATSPNGLMPARYFNAVLNRVLDFFRATPFVILIGLLLPLTRALVGSAISVRGALVPLVFSTVPFFCRQVESTLSEVPSGLIEAAQSMGCSNFEILMQVYLRESIPGIVRGFTITLVSLINLSTMTGAIGAGGIGDFAVRYGIGRRQTDVNWVCVIIILILVSVIQSIGSYIARKHTH